jgi:hypothetical protein
VVPPSDARYQRRGRRAQGTRTIAGLELLESRELLAYSPLGFSLPDLTVQAFSAPVASWGQPIAITANVYNQGSSTITEPFNQIPNGFPSTELPGQGEPGSSHANSAPTVIDVFASLRPGKGPFLEVGELAVPAIDQNSSVVVSGDINLPAKPFGFPQVGKIYFTYVVNATATQLEAGFSNNADKSRQPITLAPAAANLILTSFQVPSPLVPGQTVTPIIRIANMGTANSGPFRVVIVASTSQNFGPGNDVLATYTVSNVPPLSAVTTKVPFGGFLNVQTPTNVVTLDSQAVTLPATPPIYYLGVKVDPLNAVKEQGHLPPSTRLDAFAIVGPGVPGLPATGNATPPSSYVFPNPIPGGTFPAATVTTTTVIAPITAPSTPTTSVRGDARRRQG